MVNVATPLSVGCGATMMGASEFMANSLRFMVYFDKLSMDLSSPRTG
jgi:hypothetical protein